MAYEAESRTILVVDDDIDICELAKLVLENAGYRVVTAVDGEEGLRFFEELRACIILVLTDVTMPKMNGLELASRVLRIDSQLPVLFISGKAWSAYPGFQCIAKPVLAVELLARVHQALTA
jgi:two-component system, cell cycle sensor histidine kinase and response regulator CckA